MVLELSSCLEEKDPFTMARVVEAAREIRIDFASTPEFLAATKNKSAVLLDNGATVEMSREVFEEICAVGKRDIEEVMDEVSQWMASNIGGTEDCELCLTGDGFRYAPFRNVFEQHFDRRHTSFDRVSVSQGLAQIAAMEHPKFQGQRFDIYPL